MSCENILEVKHLCISASRGAKEKCLVGDINFSLGRGKVLGIVGESGSGKSITCYAVTGLLNPNLYISGGSIVFRGDGTDTELVGLCEKRYRKLRGSRITMVFQEPMSALNPVQRCGQQVEEVLKVHTSMSKKERKAEVLKLFEQVKLPDPQRIYSSYPHQLSGGQKQRVAIAGVVAMHPKCIVLDEPTAMLDPNGRKEVIRAVRALNQGEKVTAILITHYMEEAATADRVVVMSAGRVVMEGTPKEVFRNVEELRALHLDVPQAAELCHALTAAGCPMADDIIDVEECAAALYELLTGKKAPGAAQEKAEEVSACPQS